MLKATDLRRHVLHYFAAAGIAGCCIADFGGALRVPIGQVCTIVELFDRNGFVSRLDDATFDPGPVGQYATPRFAITDAGWAQRAAWEPTGEQIEPSRAS